MPGAAASWPRLHRFSAPSSGPGGRTSAGTCTQPGCALSRSVRGASARHRRDRRRLVLSALTLDTVTPALRPLGRWLKDRAGAHGFLATYRYELAEGFELSWCDVRDLAPFPRLDGGHVPSPREQLPAALRVLRSARILCDLRLRHHSRAARSLWL